MRDEILLVSLQNLRGTDSNSLLRMYDLANGVLRTTPSQQARARADRALRRITAELQRRKVPFSAAPP